jgi:hypothetical protein
MLLDEIKGPYNDIVTTLGLCVQWSFTLLQVRVLYGMKVLSPFLWNTLYIASLSI